MKNSRHFTKTIIIGGFFICLLFSCNASYKEKYDISKIKFRPVGFYYMDDSTLKDEYIYVYNLEEPVPFQDIKDTLVSYIKTLKKDTSRDHIINFLDYRDFFPDSTNDLSHHYLSSSEYSKHLICRYSYMYKQKYEKIILFNEDGAFEIIELGNKSAKSR